MELRTVVNAVDPYVTDVEHAEQWYDQGSWASTRTDRGDSCGYVGYPVSAEPKPKEPIRIEPMRQGFVVQLQDASDYLGAELAFTDAFDLADWLLEWLGFEEEVYDRAAVVGLARSARGIHKDYERALEVAEAAQALVKSDATWNWSACYQQLVEAVKKWQSKEG